MLARPRPRVGPRHDPADDEVGVLVLGLVVPQRAQVGERRAVAIGDPVVPGAGLGVTAVEFFVVRLLLDEEHGGAQAGDLVQLARGQLVE
jgi:hypothetical protein